MNDKRWAVVLSSDAIGLGAVRGLHEGGVPTIAVTLHRWEPTRFSRFAEKRPVPPSSDPEGAILEVLWGIAARRRPVLIPTSDFFAHFLARHRAALERRFRCCIPSQEAIDLALDKSRDTGLLAELGIPLPRTVAALPPSPAELVGALGLPLIVKPRTYVDKRELGWRNVVAYSPEHVEAFYAANRQVFGRVIAQELIPGSDDALWEYMGVFDEQSELVSAFTFRKLRTMPAHFGQTSHGRSERNEEIVELARRIGKQLRYVGPADIDLKFDHRDGTYKYLELNPRLGLCNYFATRCGVNVVMDAYRVACGEPVAPLAAQRDGVTVLALLEDVGGRLHAGDSMWRIAIDLVRALARHPVGVYFAWDDVWPGPLAAARVCYRLVERLWKGELASVFTRDYGERRSVSREPLGEAR